MSLEHKISISCNDDTCKKTRENDANHWCVAAVTLAGAIIIAPKREALPPYDNIQAPWAKSSLWPEDKLFDFCGDEHLMKWVSKIRAEKRMR